MNCDSVTREISNYIDGELAVEVRVEIELHLQGCTHCTVIIDQVRKTVALFCDTEPVDLSSEMRSRLYETLQKKLGALG